MGKMKNLIKGECGCGHFAHQHGEAGACSPELVEPEPEPEKAPHCRHCDNEVDGDAITCGRRDCDQAERYDRRCP